MANGMITAGRNRFDAGVQNLADKVSLHTWKSGRGPGQQYPIAGDWAGDFMQSGLGFLDLPKSIQAKATLPIIKAGLPLAQKIFGDPANIRAANKFFTGDTSIATNKFFKPKEMELIKRVARDVLEDRRDFIKYDDWSDVEADPYSMSALLNKVRNPREAMETVLGGVGGYQKGQKGHNIKGGDLGSGGVVVPPFAPIHFPGLGVQNRAVGPTGRYNEQRLTLRDVWDVNPGGQPGRTNPIYQAILNAGEHLTKSKGRGFPINLDLGLLSDYKNSWQQGVPISTRYSDTNYLKDWENQSKDWYAPRYPVEEKDKTKFVSGPSKRTQLKSGKKRKQSDAYYAAKEARGTERGTDRSRQLSKIMKRERI